MREREKERKENKEEERRSEKLHLLYRFYGDWTISFRRSKRQSSTMQRELRVGTRIRGFLQTPRGRGFSPTLISLGLRAIYWREVFWTVCGRAVQSKNFGTEHWNFRTISGSPRLIFRSEFWTMCAIFFFCYY